MGLMTDKSPMRKTKTEHYLQLLYKLTISPTRCLPESVVRQTLGSKSKSAWHRQINELLEGSAELPAILLKTKNPEGEDIYCLNASSWQSFIDANEEGAFLLRIYREVGYLLQSNFSEMVLSLDEMDKRKIERLDRKFLNLVKVGASKTARSRKVLDEVISSLVKEQVLEVTYEGGVRVLRPLTLIQHRDELYLVAYRHCEQKGWERRTYKLSRITGIKVLDKNYKYPPRSEWDPAKLYSHSSGLVLGKESRVTIRVYGLSRKILREKDFFAGELINHDPDFDTYSLAYTNAAELLGQLFVYAQDLEIVDDEALRAQFIEKAEMAIRRNRPAIVAVK
jgi:predicted DNA-binding transcriptional regulator YafY